jgi:hypothetical protein
VNQPSKTKEKYMKHKSYHHSNLGSHAPSGATSDSQGYITYHASPRYATASPEQLDKWAASNITAVRNAALTESAERALEIWRNK